MTPESDSELWRRIAVGEAEAFGELFERHAQAVYAFLAHRTGSSTAAEDLVSVTFLEAWRRRQTTELTNASARPWLIGIANNCARNHWRSLRRSRRAIERLPRTSSTDATDEVADRVDAARAISDAKKAISKLPRGEMEVVVLVLWNGLTYEEAAAALHIPVGTVRSRLASARKRLRAAMSQFSPALVEEVAP